MWDKVDFSNARFSLLLVEPREAFFAWLHGWQRKRRQDPVVPYFLPEENTVLVIPALDEIGPMSLSQFIDDVKPALYQLELRRFHATPSDLGPVNKDTFDKYFDVQVREGATYGRHIASHRPTGLQFFGA